MRQRCGVALLALTWTVFPLAPVTAEPPAKPLVGADVVFEETGGVVAVEAEHFFRQTLTNKRAWYLTTKDRTPKVTPDGDEPHVAGASGGAYLELLPDTRRTHGDKLVSGENFCNTPGKMAVLHYKVHFNTPGKYYVWARIQSTGSEDNGLHVGLDGTWPESGQRMQWIAKRRWAWGSKQRTAKKHTGEPGKLFLQIDKPGLHTITFSMREDGIEFDEWMMIDRRVQDVRGAGPPSKLKSGKLPKAFAAVQAPPASAAPPAAAAPKPTARPAAALPKGSVVARAEDFNVEGTNYYLDRGKWLAIDPAKHKSAEVKHRLAIPAGEYHVLLAAVGESDGQSKYEVLLDGKAVGTFTCPRASAMYAEGPNYAKVWPKVAVAKDATLTVRSQVGSADGVEHSRARVALVALVPVAGAKSPEALLASAGTPAPGASAGGKRREKRPRPAGPGKSTVRRSGQPLVLPRKPDGKGEVTVSGELKQWHKVTLTLDGPYAHEQDNTPNAFLDYRVLVTFTHESGAPKYVVPGYFAAEGRAAETSAQAGTKWRAHLAPDKTGTWTYKVSFVQGKLAAVSDVGGKPVASLDGKTGTFVVAATDKAGRDLRAKGRLQYVGKHHLRFAGTGEYFLKCGADAPENFLAYAEFDGDFMRDGQKDDLVKTWKPHVKDWRPGDPTWQKGKGKGIIGAINYLAGQGMNVFSFLSMNIGGDDRNVFPYPTYQDRDRLDCSRMDQWAIVFEHGTRMGMYLHFKTLETENELLLDGGDLGPTRKLYYRELIARFGHNLALNWNLGEEINNASTSQKKAWANYFRTHDGYRHHIVIHNGSPHYDLLGKDSALTGFSLQTNRPDFSQVHRRTLDYLRRSAAAGKPWVVACDEPGDASHALITDKEDPTRDNARKNGLWGNIMAGGAGLEWYFGYKHPHSDLTCQDYRTREKMWTQCRHALEFFRKHKIPFWDMTCDDKKASHPDAYCFYQKDRVYLVYLKRGGTTTLDMSGARGPFEVRWFNPRTGGPLRTGSMAAVTGGGVRSLGRPPAEPGKDWLAVVRPADPNRNYPPSVSAGSDQTAMLPRGAKTVTVVLTGQVADDGKPGGKVTCAWSKASGRGAVQFAAAASAVTKATLTGAGTHVLTLTGNDGKLTGSDSVTVVVEPYSTKVTKTFHPIADAYLEGGKVLDNRHLKVEGRRRVSYLKFRVEGLPSRIRSATLRLTEHGDRGSGTLRVFRGSHSNWTVATLTPANAPARGAEVGIHKGAVSASSTIAIPVSPLVTGNGTYTVILVLAEGGNDMWFGSAESLVKPELAVVAEDPVLGHEVLPDPHPAEALGQLDLDDLPKRLARTGRTGPGAGGRVGGPVWIGSVARQVSPYRRTADAQFPGDPPLRAATLMQCQD